VNLQELMISRIVSFVRQESPAIFKLFKVGELRARLQKYMSYGTLTCIWDGTEIAAVGCFNIDGHVCSVHHVIVGKKYQYKDLLRQLVYHGYRRFPYVTHLKFDRELKYPQRKSVIIPIQKFLPKEDLSNVSNIPGRCEEV
jgi:hypothetical protein